MRELSDVLTIETIENMYMAELRHQRAEVSNDRQLMFDLVHQAVELLIQSAGYEFRKDPEYCISKIKEHIFDTYANYPNYFLTGEEY